MKSIGAKNSDILWVFIIEAAALGLIGGSIGIFLGWSIASLGGSIAAGAGYGFLKPIFPITLILGCLLFASGVGAFSGITPAIQASRQKPVESLRYE
jgi:putative ABC transport system permease protein